MKLHNYNFNIEQDTSVYTVPIRAVSLEYAAKGLENHAISDKTITEDVFVKEPVMDEGVIVGTGKVDKDGKILDMKVVEISAVASLSSKIKIVQLS